MHFSNVSNKSFNSLVHFRLLWKNLSIRTIRTIRRPSMKILTTLPNKAMTKNSCNQNEQKDALSKYWKFLVRIFYRWLWNNWGKWLRIIRMTLGMPGERLGKQKRKKNIHLHQNFTHLPLTQGTSCSNKGCSYACWKVCVRI